MKRMYLLLGACLMASALASASEPEDTACWRVAELNPVVVTGTRTPKLLLDSPVQTEVITASQIAKADATNLRDLLQQIVPGVEFSYAMNQQVHMNFSGFGGQSMLVLVDGERLAGETMDDVDFARLTMDNVDHVEIVKGAASALYGSNACGGVVNIITKDASQPFALNVNGRLGRHGEQRYGLSWQQGGKRVKNILTANRARVDNYSVKSGDAPVTRVFSTVYGDATWNVRDRVAYRLSDRLTLTGRAGYFFRQLARTADAPERYRDLNAGLRGLWQIDGSRRLEASYAFDEYDKSDYQKITRLDIRGYSNVQNAFRLLYSHHLGRDVLLLGSDFMHDYLFNDKLDGKTRSQNNFDAFAQYDWNISDHWELVGALRYDYFSDHALSHLTPKLSVRYRPLSRLNVRFGYGMGFRAPTLKEKYYNFDMAGIWMVDGNPGLKAEVSHNLNLSAEYAKGNYCITANGYYNNVKNKIATGAPYYKNAADVMPHLPYLNLVDYSVVGAGLTALARWGNGITARLSYAFTDEHLPRDTRGQQVNNQYIPARKHALTAHADWEHQFTSWYRLDIALDGRILSGVDNSEYVDYYDIAKGVNTIHYPAYSIWKLSMAHRIGKAVRVTIAVDNLLNYKPKYYYLNSPLTDGINLQVGASVDIDKLF